jgi:hypothetical protein
MTALYALVALALPASADTVKEVPGLNGTGVKIEVVAPSVNVEVVCKATDKATATLVSSDTTLVLAADAQNGGAKFSISGTGSGTLKLELPADVVLKASGLEKDVKIQTCAGSVELAGKPKMFDIHTPQASVNVILRKGGLTKPSVIQGATSISMNIPDIMSAKLIAESISMNIPDLVPTGPNKGTATYNSGTPDVRLTASQSITVTR